ncbi:MAG TPA: hypothetical protein VL179_08025 [Mycobacterium sp.]|nr:hypothetical protein [Mycobacterium sp.]
MRLLATTAITATRATPAAIAPPISHPRLLLGGRVGGAIIGGAFHAPGWLGGHCPACGGGGYIPGGGW